MHPDIVTARHHTGALVYRLAFADEWHLYVRRSPVDRLRPVHPVDTGLYTSDSFTMVNVEPHDLAEIIAVYTMQLVDLDKVGTLYRLIDGLLRPVHPSLTPVTVAHVRRMRTVLRGLINDTGATGSCADLRGTAHELVAMSTRSRRSVAAVA